MATILATFPPEVREEVLLTSDDSLLATLTPALLAEAQVGSTGCLLLGEFAESKGSGSVYLTACTLKTRHSGALWLQHDAALHSSLGCGHQQA